MHDGAGDAVDTMIITLKKCPDEPGEWKQGSTECLPWRVMQGLQRNVIGMAFCCKKSVGTSERQLGMNLVPTKSHSNYMGTTVYHGPNVIRLWWLESNQLPSVRCRLGYAHPAVSYLESSPQNYSLARR